MNMRNSKFFVLIFAIVFSIPLVIEVFTLINHIKNVNIIKTGTEITATVDGYRLDNTSNDVSYFRITYSYEVDGVTHTGQTSANYMLYEAQRIQNDGSIQIKYDKNFNSIEADYSTAPSPVLFILPIFGLTGIGFFVLFISMIVHDARNNAIKNHGTKTTATFETAGSRYRVNGMPYYYITYSYTSTNGEQKSATTNQIYTYDQANYLEQLHNFEIMEYKNKTAITEELSPYKRKQIMEEKHESAPTEQTFIDNKTTTSSPEHAVEETYKRCQYCGNVEQKSVKRCSNCGSSKFEKY